MTLSHLLSTLPNQGLLLNNLFQRDDGLWQANLRTSSSATEFGLGSTPEEAIEETLAKPRIALRKDQPAFRIEQKVNILQAMGLVKPINRRV